MKTGAFDNIVLARVKFATREKNGIKLNAGAKAVIIGGVDNNKGTAWIRWAYGGSGYFTIAQSALLHF